MDKNWFTYKDDFVNGPYNKDSIEKMIQENQKFEIWGRGIPEWIESTKWNHLTQLKSSNLHVENDRRYKYRHEGRESEFISIPQLTQQIRKIKDLTYLEVQQEGTQDWLDVFKVAPIIEALGITRRAHARVPIMGIADMENAEVKFRSHIISISEGGIGITDGQGLSIGQKFKATLSSSNLHTIINCYCEVVYIGQDGYTGFRFENISAESKGVIVEYVRKFQEAKK